MVAALVRFPLSSIIVSPLKASLSSILEAFSSSVSFLRLGGEADCQGDLSNVSSLPLTEEGTSPTFGYFNSSCCISR